MAHNHPTATNPAIKIRWNAQAQLRRFVDWNRYATDATR